MKIKTICYRVNDAGLREFDDQVNDALGEGWQLVKREVLPGVNLGTACFDPKFYAELVKQDEPTEPAPLDPFEALHTVKEFCRNIPVHTCADGCPLYDWCEQLREGGDPTDWRIPEKEADQ